MEYKKANREYLAYFPLKTPVKDLNELKVCVEYTMGGYNYFSGQKQARGYRVSVKPQTRTQFGTTSILLGEQWESGLAFPLETAERYNAKRLGELAQDVDAKRIAELYELKDYKAIMELLPKKQEEKKPESFFRVLRADGKVIELDVNVKRTLEELQACVGGLIEIVRMEDGSELIVNEEGKLNGLPVNIAGTKIWEASYGKTDVVVGDVIHVKGYKWDRD